LAFLRREFVVLALLSITFGLLAWQKWGMERVVVLDPKSGLVRGTLVDDRSEGGLSVCRVESGTSGWRVHYDVRPGPNWSFCGLNLAFVRGDSAIGWDLAGFDTLVVNMLDMEGPNVRFQTQIKSVDSRMEREAGIKSMKFHDMIFAPAGSGISRTSMPLENFVIPPWWAGRHNVPARNLDPTRKDVREIEFMTSADRVVLGTGSFCIRSLELHGKWIRQDTLMKFLLAVWMLFMAGGVLWRFAKDVRAIRDLQNQTDHLKDLSERDPLTLLHNRRGLENRLASMIQRGTDPNTTRLGLLMVDVDHFKSANDTLGHDTGDRILRLLAGILQEEMRPTNIAARWGGEEFILLLPGIPPERLLPAAERVRERIQSDLLMDGRRFTVSIGAALGNLSDFDTLVKRADEALYRAKANGRNRVEIAD